MHALGTKNLTKQFDGVRATTQSRARTDNAPKSLQPKDVTLEDLCNKITKENMHEPVDWGPPVGKEVW